MAFTNRRTGLRFSPRSGPRVLVVLLLLAAPLAIQAQLHPFYDSALGAGQAAYERGDFEQATRHLRMASFGMLDDPPRLAATLTRLGLAQAAAGHRSDFIATFDRLGQIEEQFNAYSEAGLPATLKARFEQQVADWVPAESLARSAAFARLYREQETRRLQAMLPAERVAALEAVVEANPDDLARQVMLAVARVENGSGGDAVPALESMRADRPDDPRIACLLGRAYLQAEDCDAALRAPAETVQRCDVRRLPTAELVEYLQCLTGTERWLEAASVVVSLPPERRGSRPFPNWEKRIARRIPAGTEVDKLPAYEPAASGPTSQGPAPEVTPPAPIASDPPREPDPPLAELARLRSQLNAARTVSELMEVATAAELLDREAPHSGHQALHIAGEAAYRASQWQQAVEYLRASGGLTDERPELLFYLAVALYELGEVNEARQSLVRALPGLEKTAHVERYRQLILASDP